MALSVTPITELSDIPDTFVEQFNGLIKQLSRNPSPVSKDELMEVRRRADSELLLCALTDEGSLVGVVQGTFLCTPPSYRFFINTMVVDDSQRGQGLGTRLMEEAMLRSKAQWPKIKKAVLSNRPSRGNAAFYLKLGFEPRSKEAGDETVVYVKDLREHAQ